MRVIAGSAGGLSLTVPKTVTRPTTDRVREALFSSLGDRVEGAAVLDLYAGSGALGIEALSRGAASAVFVEADERASETIRGNLAKTRLNGGEVRRSKVLDFLQRLPDSARFGLVFADPPYARNDATAAELAALLASERLRGCLGEAGVFILESMDAYPLPLGDEPRWEILRDRRYGGTRLNFLQPRSRASA
ncbi:MAG: 16S rRNA (guanine(966)-N(2))-methyltransferase RsmD [Verrucomicrobiae bacterium]|nr:16S rRNA (guanine(966)-N(2))-methyltransferase RsmD [Verrucomicrobiae bacterium]